ncbi:hypothetical protein Vretimale_9168 [Volvox reticuliferus]|uniref:Uncharacterized protein n=1 Tax=Volvox reticuliferus TaxID=1737510 RepID=A0A8J4GDA7_9CHLO|nr:hypothetical protein Vretifemale_10023 [Volvox reticuliferus]GIM04628.1 hypothetical protein Vretimale_9168 [Volvox reticuliferus]
MMPRDLALSAAVLLLAFGTLQDVADAQLTVNVTKKSIAINTINGSISVYPPVDMQPTDFCPDASWKQWKLHTTPSDYDPLHWNKSQWRNYLVKHPLRASGLSIAFLLIGLFSLLVAITWRFIQWCVSCGHCQRSCGVGSDDSRFLRDTKHRYLKGWIFLLIAGALSMVIWGMLALDRELMASFWETFLDIMKYADSVQNNLETLKTNITVTVPAKLQTTERLVNNTLDITRLQGLVQPGLDFNNNTLAASNNLYSAAGSFLAALNDKVLPGLMVMAGQFGSSSNATSRRLLAQSASPYSTLNDLLPALKTSLPDVINANGTRATILGRLQALGLALAAVQAAPAPLSTDSPAVTQLATALNQTTLDLWDLQLGRIATGLQVYNISRSSPTFGDANKAAGNISTGAGSLSSAAVSQLLSRVKFAADQVNNGSAFSALKDLRLLLVKINQDIADVRGWDVSLGNGTEIAILDLTSFLVGSINDYILGDTANGLGTTMMAAASGSSMIGTRDITNVTAFLQAVGTISTLVSGASGLNASATAIAATASTFANTAASGPDPAATTTQVASVLRPALSTISSPVAAVAAALARYMSDPTVTNAAALRNAAAAAASPVSSAAISFTPPLANATALESVCRSLQPSVDKLQSMGSSFNSTALNTYDTLAAQGAEVGRYQTGVGQLAWLMSELPDGSDVKQTIADAANGIQNKFSEVSRDVETSLEGAASGLGSAINDLQSRILTPGSDFVTDNRQLTEDISNICYSAIMGAWGLGAALLLLLALSVYFNWTGGLVTFGLALLIYITLSQVVTSTTSFAMGVLDDACNDVEFVMMREMVEYSNNPRVAVLLSFYFYKVPVSPEVMLQAAFDLNTTDVRMRLQSINQTLSDRFENNFKLQGALASMVSALQDMGTSTRSIFESIVSLLRYETVHLLYMNTKSVACCGAGDFAFHEWCAITAMATLSFGALISAAYLLARLDMVEQRRRSCCSCCSCICYSPQHGSHEDEEAAKEDEFVKEARKQQDLHRYPLQLPPSQQLPSTNPLYGAGKAPDVEGVPLKGPVVVPQPQLPTGFMTAAGGAAAAAAVKGSEPFPAAYKAPPSAPPLNFNY